MIAKIVFVNNDTEYFYLLTYLLLNRGDLMICVPCKKATTVGCVLKIHIISIFGCKFNRYSQIQENHLAI